MAYDPFKKKGTKDNPYRTSGDVPLVGTVDTNTKGKYLRGNAAIKEVEKRLNRRLTPTEQSLVKREGFVDAWYLDSKGVLTRGVGQTGKYAEGDSSLSGFTAAVNDSEAKVEKQIKELGQPVTPEFKKALTSVNFQLGTDWTSKFPTAWKNMKAGDYEGAMDEIQFADPKNKPGVKSDWAKQTPDRVKDFVSSIKSQQDYVNSLDSEGRSSRVMTPTSEQQYTPESLKGIKNLLQPPGMEPLPGPKETPLPLDIKKQIENYRTPVFEVPPQFPQGDMPPGKMPYDVYQPEQQFSPFAQSTPVGPGIKTDTIDVSAPRMPYDMQEAARRSMMHGNEEDRMADYEQARFEAQNMPSKYPAGARSEVTTPQGLMGGRPQSSDYNAPFDIEMLKRLFAANQEKEAMGMRMQQQARGSMGFAYGGPVQGQNMMQSQPMMQPQSQGLASLGRNGDSTLVHMQPQEVAGLQQLAQSNGTSLTRNPITGLPEAFSLGGFFKAAAPIIAGYMVPGSPILAGALTGGGLAAATGDDPIMGAVSGGFGGMSGGGLEGAFSGIGDAMTATGAVTSDMGTQLAAQNAYAGSQGMAQTLATPGATAAPGAFTGSVGQGVNMGQTSMMTPQTSMNPFTADPLSGTSPVGRGYDQFKANLGTPEMRAMTDADKFGGAQLGKDGRFMVPTGNITPAGPLQMAKTLGSPLASMGLGGLEESDFITETQKDDRDKYDPYARLDLSNDTGINEALASDTGLRFYAGGGSVSPNGGSGGGGGFGLRSLLSGGNSNMSLTNTQTGQPMNTGRMNPEEILRNYFANASAAGMQSGFASGGYLETGGVVGDGMSDEIPATIDGQQEARLSDGEFVLPADVVSHLGNGSSDAGAKQLYNMMDRIRQARTGTKKQGNEINAGRYMPR
jgi:GH24 family phage-related lysozyme (muramidase)